MENHHTTHHWSALLPRLAQRKRKVAAYVKPLVSRRARSVACALSGVQSAEWREQGHKTTSRNPQERLWLPQGHLLCLIKTGFDRSVGGAVWALTADPCSREAQPQRLLDYSTPTVHRCGVRRRNRSTQSPSAAQAARALLPRRTRARRPASPPSLRRQTTKPPRAPCCPGSEGINARARRPWARKKRRRTMNHLH